MKKVRIKVVELGQQKFPDIFNKLKKYNSDIFEVECFENKLPQTDFGWGYNFKTLSDLLSVDFDYNKYDMCIGFLDYEIENNWYGKCLDDDETIYVMTSFQAIDCLKQENIDPFNFLICGIYRFVTRHITNARLAHDETRGCLFDMAGYKWDIIYATSKPTLCIECENYIKTHTVPDDFITILKKEIKKIRKQKYYIIADFIKKHPYISLFIGGITAIVINIFSNYTYDYMVQLFKK